MLLNNNNKSFMKTLSDNCLKANKMRNRIAMIAIVLTAILFTTLATVAQGAVFSIKEQQIKQSGTRFMASMKYLSLEKAKEVMENPAYTESGLSNSFAIGVNEELRGIRTILTWQDDAMVENSFSKPEEGELPQKENEVACDSEVLKALGLPYKVGSEFTLQYRIDKEVFEADMVVSGIWKGEKYESSAQMLVSEAFLKKHLDKGTESQPVAESYCVYGSFKSTENLEAQLEQVVKDAGYDPLAERGEAGFVVHNTNNVYVNKNELGAGTIVSGIVGVLIVLLAGYLIIYNIFRISIMKDIRLYGQLKTIGTSPRQIKFMIRRQGIKLAFMGIPIGLVLGWILGNLLLPVFMQSMTFKESQFIMPNVLVWVFAALFTFLTVLISVSRPGKTAGRISPVEALRYQESGETKKKQKSRKNGQESGHRIIQMAYANLGRNKGKTVLVVLSISLSSLLLNSVWNFTGSMDKQTYVKRDVVRDFNVTSNNFTSNFDEDYKSVVPGQFIDAIQSEEDVTDLGYVYYRGRLESEDETGADFMANITMVNGEKVAGEEADNWSQMYGYDESVLKDVKVVEGAIDYEKLKTGDYVFLAGYLDDYGEFSEGNVTMHAGDRILTNVQGVEKEVEVLAVIGVKSAFMMNYSSGGYLSIVFAENIFLQQFPENQNPIHCVFNAKEGTFDRLNGKLQQMSKSMNIGIMTKLYAEEQFKEMQNTYNGIGSVLAFVFAAIGILNLLNVILTGAIARKGEFATMRSIGMSKRQLRKLFIVEALFYAIVAGVAGIVISAVLSLTMVRGLTAAMWFAKYRFMIAPAVGAAAVCIVVAAVIASLVDRMWNKGSIVENLRGVE